MTYSFTEKKRIRKSYGKRRVVQEVPYLLATQLESYSAFLQESTPGDRRKEDGLQAAFKSIFPSRRIRHGPAGVVRYGSTPAFDSGLPQRGLTFRAPLLPCAAGDHDREATIRRIRREGVRRSTWVRSR